MLTVYITLMTNKETKRNKHLTKSREVEDKIISNVEIFDNERLLFVRSTFHQVILVYSLELFDRARLITSIRGTLVSAVGRETTSKQISSRKFS